MNQPWDVHGAQVGDCCLQGTVRPPVPRLKGSPALEGLQGRCRHTTVCVGGGSPTPGCLGTAGPLCLLRNLEAGSGGACQRLCHLLSMCVVGEYGGGQRDALLPGTVREVSFQRALLPSTKATAGARAAVQTRFN